MVGLVWPHPGAAGTGRNDGERSPSPPFWGVLGTSFGLGDAKWKQHPAASSVGRAPRGEHPWVQGDGDRAILSALHSPTAQS